MQKRSAAPDRTISRAMKQPERGEELRRYARAAAASLAIAFVIFVANPSNPPTYAIGIALLVGAAVLFIG